MDGTLGEMKPTDQPQLFDYGIHNEGSDIRAHVGMIVQRAYVFPTSKGVAAIKRHISNGNGKVYAKQPNVNFYTASGFPVPWNEIEGIKRVQFPIAWVMEYRETMTLTEKGNLAVSVIEKLLKDGRFPLWIDPIYCEGKDIQISGTDIVVKGTWKIQVKCDARCGEKELGGTGNIFLQVAERNPFKYV
jgi:hypothetical protein